MQLSAQECDLVRRLRDDYGILQNVEGHKLDQTRGVILVTCADGDQIDDIYNHQCEQVKMQHGRARVHTLALNGGALLLSPESPLYISGGLCQGAVLAAHIKQTIGLKAMRSVALYAHLPCGAARAHTLSVIDVLKYLIRAKVALRWDAAFGDLGIACFCHVDKGEAGKRTYFVSREHWDRFGAQLMAQR